MSTEIYYFSGTGNSLFVAKELQKRIPDAAVIPIVSLLDQEVIQTHGEIIGFVFPAHALTIPVAVRKFIQKLDLKQSEYVFAIATRWGTVFHGFEKMDQLLKKKNKSLNSQFIFEMGGNDARNVIFTVPGESDLLSKEKVILNKLDTIKDIIAARADSHEKDTEHTIQSASNPLLGFFIEKIVVLGMDMVEYLGGVNYFYSDSKCNGCGVCEKVCLSKKVKMVNKKPVWQKNTLCYMCYACLNYCPQKSIQIRDIPGVKSYTMQNDRYPHPYAGTNEISVQKADAIATGGEF